MLLKIIILTISIGWVGSVCAYQCSSCSQNSNAYACVSCGSGYYNQYIWSCQNDQYDVSGYIAIPIMVVILHFFSLSMGIGIYRQIFQNIQLVTLTTWRYGFQGSSIAIQALNLGYVKSNSFINNFGIQFLIALSLLCCFWLLFVLVQKNMHNSTAILIRRKKIIFPVRIQTLIFNMLLFSSLIQLTTTNLQINLSVFSFSLAILGIVFTVVMLVGLGILSNWRRFQVDDPHYYVLMQQMTSKKWYAKNNVLFSLIVRGLIILIYVLLFKTPQVAGILMTVLQICYSIYVMVFIRYTKIRYFVAIITANIMVVSIYLVIFMGAISDVGSSSWQQFSNGYVVLTFTLLVLFFVSTMLEVILKREIVVKQMKSIYNRFIKCEKLQDRVIVSKYDENSNRERVTEFKTNLLYHKDLGEQEIELRQIN